MRSPRIREVFALLTREYQQSSPALSADAERAIRARVTRRWTARGAATVAVVGLGVFAVSGALGGTAGPDGDASPTRSPATPSPTSLPAPAVAAATFPLDGGPEFASPWSTLACGDPVPASAPEAHGVEISLRDPDIEGVGTAEDGSWPWVSGVVSSTTDRDRGVLATSGIDFLVVDDGIIVGRLAGGNLTLGWTGISGTQGDHAAPLVSNFAVCGPPGQEVPANLEEGDYSIVVISRVFSTPESVALAEAYGAGHGHWNLDPANASVDPYAVYLPGSFDCAAEVAHGSPPRACLPDFSSQAVIDAEAGTVTVLYDAANLVEEFDVLLVSEPLDVTLRDSAALGWQYVTAGESSDVLSHPDQLMCGASGSIQTDYDESGETIGVDLDEHTTHILEEGGIFGAAIMAWAAPDGSLVELLPGARVIYVDTEDIETETDGSMYMTTINTVVGTAAVMPAGPVTSSRYDGPQLTTLSLDPVAICPGFEEPRMYSHGRNLIAGEWRITAPDGTVTTQPGISDFTAGRLSYSFTWQ